jgi:predicted nucleic acid-binding protein
MGRSVSEVRRIYADTNIFIMIFESKAPQADCLSAALIPRGERDPALVTSLITYSELMVGPIREDNEKLAAAYETLFASPHLIDVVAVDQGILRTAAGLRAGQRSLKLPDAVHIASAFHAGCSHFVSDEARFPSAFQVDGVTLAVLRPDPEGLAELGRLASE